LALLPVGFMTAPQRASPARLPELPNASRKGDGSAAQESRPHRVWEHTFHSINLVLISITIILRSPRKADMVDD